MRHSLARPGAAAWQPWNAGPHEGHADRDTAPPACDHATKALGHDLSHGPGDGIRGHGSQRRGAWIGARQRRQQGVGRFTPYANGGNGFLEIFGGDFDRDSTDFELTVPYATMRSAATIRRVWPVVAGRTKYGLPDSRSTRTCPFHNQPLASGIHATAGPSYDTVPRALRSTSAEWFSNSTMRPEATSQHIPATLLSVSSSPANWLPSGENASALHRYFSWLASGRPVTGKPYGNGARAWRSPPG
jgi:hypothetical protein